MPEIKNNFLSSKMNQDIDDRLMPNNEYRYALNLEVNRSESSNVGTLQNILGNSLAVDFNSITGTSGLECIGVLTDDSNNNIYVFLTNYSGTLYNNNAKNYIYVYDNAQNTSTLLVSGAFLNFSTQFPIYGVNLIENLLFWTDNRNQPRRINVEKASSNIGYYINEEQISVAKLSPLYTPELFRESELEVGEYETTMYDVISEFLPDGTTSNPYFIEDWPGDPAYLESRYVRFSYRYKFEDGEYSIMAPFTQIAYIPKQDGYFMYTAPVVPGDEPVLDDETSAYRSTIVSFMQNKVNNILLQIYLPGKADEINSLYKITEIEILYKESDSIVVSVVDSIPTVPDPGKGPLYFWNTEEQTYSYNYQSKKPFKTLPERDVIRVYDTTPVKALSQEVAGNRVVYGNYQDKFSYPKYLDYNVGASTKLPFGFGENQGTSLIEYPNHSVKENRNYQVGVVLCDRFGRQSGVILSDLIEGDDTGQFGASSLYLPYSGVDDILPSTWPGNSLKILFNNTISPAAPNLVTGWPGLYNGDPTSANYNPLGWYAYKIVVKQIEQDYYNVYLPGLMASYPNSTTLELGKTSHSVLINDNINKIPRDLSEVGPSQKQFRSSVILYPRVGNNTEPYNNQQIDPGNTYAFVSTIATNNSLFFPNGVFPTSPAAGFLQFYQIDSDPLIARISTVEKLGVLSSGDVINLAIYETKPIESKLDIYWETSTTGLISELNTAIQLGTGEENIESLLGWEFNLYESDGPGTNVSGDDGFIFENILGNPVSPTSVTIESVFTLTGVNVTNKFVIEQIGITDYYRIKTAPAKYFYYGFNAVNAESYIFTIKATIGSPVVSETFTKTGSLTNILPTIDEDPVIPNPINVDTGETDVYQFYGVNGSNVSGGNSTSDLTWSVSGNPMFTITSTGLLQELSGSAQGTFNLTVTLTEASGGTDFVNIVVVYPTIDGNMNISNQNSGGSSQISNVLIDGNGVTLDSGTFPIEPLTSATASYTFPTSTSSTIVVGTGLDGNFYSVKLTVAGVGSFCEFSDSFAVFPGLNLSTGPAITVTLAADGDGC